MCPIEFNQIISSSWCGLAIFNFKTIILQSCFSLHCLYCFKESEQEHESAARESSYDSKPINQTQSAFGIAAPHLQISSTVETTRQRIKNIAMMDYYNSNHNRSKREHRISESPRQNIMKMCGDLMDYVRASQDMSYHVLIENTIKLTAFIAVRCCRVYYMTLRVQVQGFAVLAVLGSSQKLHTNKNVWYHWYPFEHHLLFDVVQHHGKDHFVQALTSSWSSLKPSSTADPSFFISIISVAPQAEPMAPTKR